MLPNPYKSQVEDAAQAVDALLDRCSCFDRDARSLFEMFGKAFEIHPELNIVEAAYLYSVVSADETGLWKYRPTSPNLDSAVVIFRGEYYEVKFWIRGETFVQFGEYLSEIENTETADPMTMALYNAVRDVTGEIPF